MKSTGQILAVLMVLVLMISLWACGAAPEGISSGTEIPSQPEQPQPQGPSSEEEAPTALPATLPEDTTELRVAFQMTSPEETTWDDAYPAGELNYSTQADVDVCRQWLYDLRAGDLTGMYGETSPLDHYWTGEMTLEDSRRIVDLLRSAAPDLAPLASGNPPTGGGWDVAIHTGEEAVRFGFNGEWFTFVRDGKGWIFDGTAAQQSLGEIDALLWEYGYRMGPLAPEPTAGNTVSEAPPAETYFDENVQAIYAVDREKYVMAEIKDGYGSSKEIWEGLKNRASSKGEASGYGYLIITDEGKEYVYLNDSDGDTALNKSCQAALNNGPLHPSWLIHMTPERIKEFKVMGAGNDDPITDRDQLLAVAKFLKKEATVQPEVTVSDGPTNPDMVGGLFWLKLTFDSGVQYDLMGYDYFDGTGSVSVYSSDLNKRVSYTLDDGVASKFTAYK